jgi:AcrR family transcriptional regulator
MFTHFAQYVKLPPMPSTTTSDSKAPDTLLDGAMEQFKRHGFAKTSMSDIARASGLSRTSLYNHFQTKEDVFKSLSSRINEQVLEDVMQALKVEGTWDQRLAGVIHARVSWVYVLLHDSEFGRELINEKNRICGGQVLASNDRLQTIVTSILEEGISGDLDASHLTELVLNSINGVLEKATSRTEARENVAVLVRLFCDGAKATRANG